MADQPTETAQSQKKRLTQRERDQARIPLRITDTTLRDAHQSLWATRMRTDDMLRIADVMDAVGFYSVEVWGGATFDVCLRYLRENPWERLRALKKKFSRTPTQMLLRGQNVVGYRNYPDDVLERFVALACKNGMDIFRIFDALNDTRNLEKAITMVKKYGGHAQGTICYTISPVHTIEKYVRIAKEQVALGIDSLCIKDMAGFLSPIAAERLVSALIRHVRVPVQLHCHTTSGMATSTYVEGVRAGAGAIDCAISPMAGFSSQPPVETMITIFEEMPYHANLDREALRKMCDYFEDLAEKMGPPKIGRNIIDPEILMHHIPGGMISNLRSQLEQQNALDRLPEVLEEIPKVREDLGYPPLVTPTSQIVGVQAVLNVLSGERYSMVPQETRDYVKGLYGRPPGRIDSAVREKILGKEKPITCRPADLLPPMLPDATKTIEPSYIREEEDILSYCLFPEQALEYFKWRSLPEDKRSQEPADAEKQKAAKPSSQESVPPPKPGFSAREHAEIAALLQKIYDLNFDEVIIRRKDISVALHSHGPRPASAAGHAPPPDARSAKPSSAAEPTPASSGQAAASQQGAPADDLGPVIESPLNGTFYRTPGPGKPPLVNDGDTVKAGTPVAIVEAMKLFNQIKAPFDCKIVKTLVEHGKPVKKGQPLFSVEKV